MSPLEKTPKPVGEKALLSSAKKYAKMMQSELRNLYGLRHNNVMSIRGFHVSSQQIAIVMDLMQYGSLYDCLHNDTLEIDEEMATEILEDVAEGMKYLHTHSPSVVHRYLSSPNVLLDRNLNAKVSDIAYPRKGRNVAANLAKARSLLDLQERSASDSAFQDQESAGVEEGWITPSCVYMAPEILKGLESGKAADVYAFGVLIYEVLARRDPYSDQADPTLAILVEIVDGVIDFSKRLPKLQMAHPLLNGICRDCLLLQADLRPSFKEINRRMQAIVGGASRACFQNTFSESLTHLVDKGLGISMRDKPWSTAVFSSRIQKRKSGGGKIDASERLVLQVFPKHVAEALMDNRKVEPEEHSCVTIFFSDIVGYTAMASKMEPHLVMDMLDRLYTKFDMLTEKYNVFKVETIGDAYMAVSNLHTNQQDDHVWRMACFALATVEAANSTYIDQMT